MHEQLTSVLDEARRLATDLVEHPPIRASDERSIYNCGLCGQSIPDPDVMRWLTFQEQDTFPHTDDCPVMLARHLLAQLQGARSHDQHANTDEKENVSRLSFLKDVVCISGSMRFFVHMLELAARLSRQGKIVLAPFATKDGATDADAALDELHERKIALSETLYVVAVEGSIGESTRNEIAFAEARGIPVVFWQPKPGESDPQ